MHRLTGNKAHQWVVGALLFIVVMTVPAARAMTLPTEAEVSAVHYEQVASPVAAQRGYASVRSERLAVRPTPHPTRPPHVEPKVQYEVEPTPLPTPVDPGTPWPDPTPPPTPTPKPVVAVSGPGPVWPVAGGTISQLFSAAHPALDIYAPCGTAELSAWGGTIQYAGWKDNGGGNVVDIRFDNGLLGSYNHMQAIYVSGGYVAAGTVLGEVGMTGTATGCHLHFGLMSGGVWVDPLGFLGG